MQWKRLWYLCKWYWLINLGKWEIQPCGEGTFCNNEPFSCIAITDMLEVPKICPLEVEESSVYGSSTDDVKCLSITDGQACDPLEYPEVCASNNRYAQCLQTPQKKWLMRFMKRNDDSSLVGKWLERDCPDGTVCKLVKGKVECQDARFVTSDCS
eukprot:NODE_239_length_13273_cov_0.404964.p7 type:complete len:155 gc:universal NODE_239_length_13273_cov_0.404964:4061-3597(-)